MRTGIKRAADGFTESFGVLSAYVYNTSAEKGWHDKPRDQGTVIALMHAELSEALEGLRHGNPPSDHIPEFSAAEEEFADVIIRIMDHSFDKKYRVAEAVSAKLEFNRTREYKHGGKLF